MPDWDALYLAKWLLIGLREPRTRWSRYSFSLLKCSLNCLHTGCLCSAGVVVCNLPNEISRRALLRQHRRRSSRAPGECLHLLAGMLEQPSWLFFPT